MIISIRSSVESSPSVSRPQSQLTSTSFGRVECVGHLNLSGDSRSIVLLSWSRSRGRSRSSSLLRLGLSVNIIVFLTGAVDGNLHSDDAAINVLAVHLANSLGLELLRGKVDEAKATGLAALVASLQLLDHEAGDGTQGNLGRDGLVGGEDLLELKGEKDG